MLQVGDDDLVAGQQMLAAPGVGHQVDRFGGAAHEDDLFVLRRADESPNRVAGLFVGIGRPGRQLVRGAVDVGVLVGVEVRQPVDHHLRLLGGRGVVEPDQRLSVDGLLQDREVRPHRVDVEHLVVVAATAAPDRRRSGSSSCASSPAGAAARARQTSPGRQPTAPRAATDGAEPRGATGTVGGARRPAHRAPSARCPGWAPRTRSGRRRRAAGTGSATPPPHSRGRRRRRRVGHVAARGDAAPACGGGSDLGAARRTARPVRHRRGRTGTVCGGARVRRRRRRNSR